MKDMLWHKLLETVLLLLGLAILNTAITMGGPLIVYKNLSTEAEHIAMFAKYSHWIAKIAFGLLIYYKLRHIRIAAPIGLLSTAIPVVGALFYLMTSALTQTNNDR